jgi:hypothetical protein
MPDQTADPMPDEAVDVVARARTAARAGDLDTALRLLQETGHRDPQALDLLARVHAQRGELERADECWAQVQRDVPGDPAAAAGRSLIAQIRDGRRRARPRVTTGRKLVALLCLFAVGATALVIWAAQEPAPAARTPRERTPGELAAARRADVLAAQLAAQRARAAAQQRAESARVAKMAEALNVRGVTARANPRSVRLWFKKGLFSTGDRLTADGAAVLDAVGERLAGQNARVHVVGYVAVGRGGSALSLLRALVAARVLSAGSGTPLSAFTTAAGARVPFKETDRSRTVMLIVTPRLP